MKFGAELPEAISDSVYISPSKVLIATPQVQKLSLGGWVMQGMVGNQGANTNKIKSLRNRSLIQYTGDDTACASVLNLFLAESSHENDTWLQAQFWQLPDTVAAATWLKIYDALCRQLQSSWNRFILLQQQVDDIVADWYSFDLNMREAIANGLPWARRRRVDETENLNTDHPVSSGQENNLVNGIKLRMPVESSLIYSVGYDEKTRDLVIEFHTGEVFMYENVPTEKYKNLMSAVSKGKYYSWEIKGKYNSRKLS